MLETLYIRLGSHAQDPIHWLIWASAQQEIIASGELNNASQLSELTEKSQQREVISFIPGCDAAIKSLKVPGNSVRALRLAAPYMLEDDLAQDVESLFFAYSVLKKNDQGDNCFIAVVAREQILNWKSWLSDAEIKCKVMIPDVLAMPFDEGQYSAVVLGEQILLRQSQWQGMVVDVSTWQLIAAKLFQSNQNKENNLAQINCYSALPDVEKINNENTDNENPSSEQLSNAQFNVTAMPEELPLALLAQHVDLSLINLLQGEFQVKAQRSPALIPWLWVAGIAGCALLMNVGIKGAQLIQLNVQQQQVEEQIISLYKKTFPETKRVRIATIKSQLTQKMEGIGTSSANHGFLAMMNEIQPAFSAVEQLQAETIKYDGKRNEIRLQAIASDYQTFDNFRSHLEKAKLKVSQGSQNSQGDKISGSFSISSRGKQS
ncbi:MAG: general secretion pathway protein L [Alteromonadaceae bacterium]|jgi:general secretion pathway protein L